jgi:hypothetical protein
MTDPDNKGAAADHLTSQSVPESAPQPISAPTPPLTSWWQFWRGTPETVLARATVFLAISTLALAGIALIQARILEITDASTRDVARATVTGQRPFIFKRTIWFETSSETNDVRWRFVIEWENGGNTAPLDLRFRPLCGVGAVDMEPPFRNDYGHRESATPTVLRPRQSEMVGRCPVEQSDLDEVAHHRRFLFVGGEPTYRDVFDPTYVHITRFCHEYETFTGNGQHGTF